MRGWIGAKKAAWGWLVLAVWALAGCVAQGQVRDVVTPPSGFNPQLKAVCHDKGNMAVAELPPAFLQNKSKIVLLVKLQVGGTWAPFDPSITVNDKGRYYLKPDIYKKIQTKALEINVSDLIPGMNTIKLYSGYKLSGYSCSGPCCGIGMGFAFEDDPRIPFI